LALGPLNQRIGGGDNEADSFGDYAAALKNHACVLGWAGFDEAGVNAWTTSQMLAAQAAVHANDNNHPFFYDDNTVPYLNLSYYYPNQVADVFSSDNYPLCYAAPFASTGGKTFVSWLDMMDRDTRANYGLLPDLVVLELYKFVYAPSSFDCTKVTATTVYNEAWLSVIHGRKGVTWYDNGSSSEGYGPVCENDADTECFPAAPSTHIGKFTAAIAAITPDVVLAAPGSKTITSNRTTPGSHVDVALRESGTTLWAFAARVTDVLADAGEATADPLSTTLTISGMTGTHRVTVYGESRALTATDGVFTDTFSPYGVHLYQITPRKKIFMWLRRHL
jgi:hypothetical protein